MSKKKPYLSTCAGVFAGLLLALSASSQSSMALTGIVTSDAEGAMEGVLVKAKRVGGTVTITVVSDDHGRYSFPADRLKPGQYELTVRATGYDAPPSTVTLEMNATNADLKLNKVGTYALADQLTPAEWEMSVSSLSGCGGCHNLNVVLKSTYDVKGWMATLVRMRNYEPGASFSYPYMLPEQTGPRPGDEQFAKYLASINLSSKQHWDFE